jgi:NAD(P)-dependent dehydrogenase (short-subunit alcohol dehydrogenase family)
MSSMDLFKLDGRTALITGGTGGLGIIMAKALSEAGARVVITSRSKEKAVGAASQIAAETGNETLGLAVEVTDAEQVEAMVTDTAAAFGTVDILINSAGINIRKPIEEYDEESWDLVHNTNLKAPFLCSRAVARRMKEQRYGRIINLASMLGEVGLPERSAYCSSKGGVIQLTKVLALEFATYNVTVNALCPGPIGTELNAVVMNNPEANKFFIENIPIGRWGKPSEIAGPVLFLASEASSFMTGATLTVDGGWTAK